MFTILKNTLFILAGMQECFGLATNPVVTTTYGDVQGASQVLDTGDTIHRFLAIPYAAPPVGDLRFHLPVEHPGWVGTVRNATQSGNTCLQTNLPMSLPPGIQEDEDCLTLNIYVPVLSGSTGEPLSVMVYIHDGVFQWGSSWFYDGTMLAISGNVIVVTMNYRLDLLGWISSGDNIIPGNTGFFDQRLALCWIKDNIAAFGGDPDSMTIFGLSAGAESVMAHIYSPRSSGLFSRAIVESVPASWQYPKVRDQRNLFRQFAAHVNCDRRRTAAIVTCLQALPAQDLKSSVYSATFPNLGFGLAFRVMDGAFLTDQPRNLLTSGRYNDVDLIIGFNSHDGNVFLREGLTALDLNLTDVIKGGFPQIPGLPPNFLLNLASQSAIGFVVSDKPYIVGPGTLDDVPNFDLLLRMVEHEYYTGVLGDPAAELQAVLTMTTTATFGAYASFIADTFSANPNTTTYIYHFSYRSPQNAIPGALIDIGAFHSDEIFYVFGLLPFTDPVDLGLQSAMMSAWTSFAKTGQAVVSENTFWPEYDSTTRLFWHFNGDNGGTGLQEARIFDADINYWNTILTPVSQLRPGGRCPRECRTCFRFW